MLLAGRGTVERRPEALRALDPLLLDGTDMIRSVMIWNEPNNVSHWDLEIDPDWSRFANLLQEGVQAVRRHSDVPLVLGGMSPLDPAFVRLMDRYGALDGIDVLGVHGFPMDWNLWPMEEWPDRIAGVREEFGRPVWVTETGVSSFATEKKAAWGIRRMSRILRNAMREDEKIHWYTLFDLDPVVEATTRHKQAEASGYFRHFHFGLLRHDGTPKQPVLRSFPAGVGICQWFQYEDETTLRRTVEWMERLNISYIRTGLSWAESFMDNGWGWLDTIVSALEPFDVCATLCFTPPHLGIREHHTSPPREEGRFAEFAEEVARRYAPVRVG